jgi:hypothetical protein
MAIIRSLPAGICGGCDEKRGVQEDEKSQARKRGILHIIP